MADDSSLSIASNIIGIITFVFAVAAAIYARWLWLKSRILLSQAFKRSYDRLELVMWDVGMLHDPIDFEPSEALMHIFERTYTDYFSMSRCLTKLASKTALQTRITKSDAEEYLKLLASLEARNPIARNWYMHEQTLAAITRIHTSSSQDQETPSPQCQRRTLTQAMQSAKINSDIKMGARQYCNADQSMKDTLEAIHAALRTFKGHGLDDRSLLERIVDRVWNWLASLVR